MDWMKGCVGWGARVCIWKIFFFFEKGMLVILNQEFGKSSDTKHMISVGTHSNQIWEEIANLAHWAKACATALPCRPTWAKEILWK